METVSIRNPGMTWDIATNIHFPSDFDASKRYPAIVSNHPIGSCKEQTAGNIYGTALADAGFVVLVPDASFQGASGGSPRWIDPAKQRMKDYRDAALFWIEQVVLTCLDNWGRRRLPGPPS